MKNYLIAVDLDNTLVYEFDKYDTKSFELLKTLSKTNKVVIATGRPYRSSKYYYDLLELDTPIINYNGALVHNPKDPNFKPQKITIDKQIVIDLVKDNMPILHNIFCEVGDDIYLLKDTDEVIPFLHQEGGFLTIGDLAKTLKENPNGAIVMTKKSTEQELENYIKTKYQDHLKIRFWNVQQVVVAEIYSPLTSKGNALNSLSNYYNIPKEKVIAIGDGHNDIEMLEYAGISVAMENAHPDLLKVAKHKTDTVHNNGVYNFLKTFFKL
ncbi:MAG TPA: HAD family hydrolase [Acholeplasmataceae bacterium]|nr:HAD family hydrolase [Acholeplasmataceae bacterium]